MVSDKKDFEVFPKSRGANGRRGVSSLKPRGMAGRFDVGDHLTLLHTKYLSSELYGFREKHV